MTLALARTMISGTLAAFRAARLRPIAVIVLYSYAG